MSDPIFYDTLDALYHAVVDRPPEEKAFLLGGGGIYLVINRLQWASKNIMNYYISTFDEKWLPNLEKACIAGMAAAPFLCYLIAPEATTEAIDQNPVYTSGMAGIWFESIIEAGRELYNRAKQPPLEEILSE